MIQCHKVRFILLQDQTLYQGRENVVEPAQIQSERNGNADDDEREAQRFLPGRPVDVPELGPGLAEESRDPGKHGFGRFF
jgi:hypothetical protein